MMLSVSDLLSAMKLKHPQMKFYNGCINKNEKCIGLYARGNDTPPSALDSKPSYGILPITMLVHWGENSNECEQTANTLYEGLEDGISSIKNIRIIHIKLLDSSPINIGRDDKNICEMTIRFNILYERR